ncbi:MAG: hypothetical protein ABL907_09460 [Hyphomicrobium sp.]
MSINWTSVDEVKQATTDVMEKRSLFWRSPPSPTRQPTGQPIMLTDGMMESTETGMAEFVGPANELEFWVSAYNIASDFGKASQPAGS